MNATTGPSTSGPQRRRPARPAAYLMTQSKAAARPKAMTDLYEFNLLSIAAL